MSSWPWCTDESFLPLAEDDGYYTDYEYNFNYDDDDDSSDDSTDDSTDDSSGDDDEQLRQVLLAHRLGGDVAGSDNTPETEHDDDGTISPSLAAASDDTPLEIDTGEDEYVFQGYDDDLYHHLGEADEASSGYTPYGLEFETYKERAGEEASADSSGCVICLVEYEIGDELTTVLCPGQHTFHRACLAVWLQRNLSCPLCRFDLSN